MELEKILADDRVNFETRVAKASNDADQFHAGARLCSQFFEDAASRRISMADTKARLDAFMGHCVEYKVCRGLTAYALRSSFSGSDFIHRKALTAYYNSLPPTPLLSSIASRTVTPNGRLVEEAAQRVADNAKEEQRKLREDRELNMQFLALRGTVDEYNAWLDSLKGRTKPPSRDDYTIRDSILRRLQEQATPHVIGKLLEAIGK